MIAREYDKAMLFMGVLSTRGFPESLVNKLETLYGPILIKSTPFPFDFTDYYVPEMGEGIERFFISFRNLVSPDTLASIKEKTNEIEKAWADDGKRRINLDPGLLSESSIILATTKNRAHRIAIGLSLYAELTLVYQNRHYVSFPWTYADYRSERVQNVLYNLRNRYKEIRKLAKTTD